MRLGGPLWETWNDPEAWVEVVKKSGYRAVPCPIEIGATPAEIAAYAEAAQHADILIAEVGAWSNPLSPILEERKAALEKCKQSLALADQIGALCCVNITGSRGDTWDGPHADNLTKETFEMIVETVRDIIDTVQPTRAFYTLETMPWMYPDSPESYLELLQAIDRKACAAHLDPVNLICSPQRYFQNSQLISKCFELLGPWIKSCHAKDISLSSSLTVHLSEVRPGLGALDYRTFLRCAHQLDANTPLLLEHLPNATEYQLAASYIRKIASQANIAL